MAEHRSVTVPTGALKSRSPVAAIQTFIAAFALVALAFTGIVFDFWAFSFLLVLVGSGYCIMAGYAVATSRPAKVVPPPVSSITFNLIVCAVSLVGLFALWFDRTSIRGIDYLDVGIAAARAELNREGERGGLISVFGNLFSVAIYLPLINMIFDWEQWGRGRALVATAVGVCIAALIYLTAGRTVVLIAMALAASAMLGRGVFGRPRMPSFLTVGRLLAGIVGIIFLFGLIFALRANAFGAAGAGDYLNQMCIHLSQPAIEIMSQCPTIIVEDRMGGIGEFLNYGSAVLIYAFHVAWVGDVIIFDQNPGLTTSFAGVGNLFFGRFGYQVSATDYDGYFIPAAPGMIFDFGYTAMIVSFIVLGLAFGIAQRFMQAGHIGTGRVAFCMLGTVIFLSVLISAANLPFLVLSVLAIFIVMALQKLYVALVVRRVPAQHGGFRAN